MCADVCLRPVFCLCSRPSASSTDSYEHPPPRLAVGSLAYCWWGWAVRSVGRRLGGEREGLRDSLLRSSPSPLPLPFSAPSPRASCVLYLRSRLSSHGQDSLLLTSHYHFHPPLFLGHRVAGPSLLSALGYGSIPLAHLGAPAKIISVYARGSSQLEEGRTDLAEVSPSSSTPFARLALYPRLSR